jgi:Toastrack DUF4097
LLYAKINYKKEVQLKIHKLLLKLFFIIIFISCSENSVVEEEVLFEYTQRSSSSFFLSGTEKTINIENPIGFVNVSGGSDSVEVAYVLDKTVQVSESSLSQAAFDKIILTQYIEDDTARCKIDSPIENTELFDCNVSLIVPYSKPIVVKNTNGGVNFSNLSSNVFAETDADNLDIRLHNGSLEAKSNTGQISGSISLPENGYCNCYSESGDIHLQILTSTSSNIHLKTVSGTITYTNVEIDIISNSNTELKGSMNNGEGNIYLESTTGNIILEGI